MQHMREQRQILDREAQRDAKAKCSAARIFSSFSARQTGLNRKRFTLRFIFAQRRREM
jgi:hypothetical protein